MKILLREYNGKPYVWVDAEINNLSSFKVNEDIIFQTGVISIVDDNRNKYRYCNGCHEVIRNTKRAIAQHTERSHTSATCFGCSSMCKSSAKQTDCKYKLLEDGQYAITTKQTATLVCNNYYRQAPDINSDEARKICKYKGCTNEALVRIKDVFTEYPGIFDDIITVDKIAEAGFKSYFKAYSKTYYILKAKSKIEAVVNELNIVESFRIYGRNGACYGVVYSPKTNELYSFRNQTYQVFRSYDFANSTLENIKAKIASLYA